MDFQRTLLFGALGLILLMIWQTWELEQNPVQTTAAEQNSPPVSVTEKTDSAQIPAPEQAAAPSVAVPTETNQAYQGDIRVQTDTFEIKIDSKGGKIVQLNLRKYPVDIKQKDKPFSLLRNQRPLYIAENGIKGVSRLDQALFPDHHAKFTSDQQSYTLTGDTLEVPLVWADAPAGLSIHKTYVFTKGSYVVGVRYRVENKTGGDWKGSVYSQLQREGLQENEERSFTNYSYTGAVYYEEENGFHKQDFDDLKDKNLNLSTPKGWAGFMQHYFTGAVIPQGESRLYSYRPGNNYVIGALNPVLDVPAGQQGESHFTMFLGPKLQEEMEAAAKGLDLTADYGWLTVIAKPIFWVLKQIHTWVQNWGVAIILVTALIKLIFYKLSETSYKSMARMRKLQPRLTAMKERFGDDKQKMNQAMMKMYQEEKVNPMGGCLPILVQIPVFIALYWVLLEGVELRQASFLWLEDLSIKDPFYILPLIMGISMFIQQRLNPTPTDPIQAKVMMFLPVIFTVFFAFFPSGLVLYWVVNNILSITQQWVITKRIAG